MTTVERAFVLSAMFAAGLACAQERYDFFEPELMPAPKQAQWTRDVCVRLDSDIAVDLACGGNAGEAKSYLERKLNLAFRIAPKIAIVPLDGEEMAEEEYSIKASAGRLAIRAATIKGVRHAFHTLRQIAIADRGGMLAHGWIMPAFDIRDKPSLAFRGVHICWFPENRIEKIESAIRLAAYYKFNYAVLENWGVWRSEKHPWFGWSDGKMTSGEIARLVKIAADEGLTLIPQLNIVGHASLTRLATGSHATLDFSPQYAPLFEPYGGWNWCLSNPESRRILKEMALEMHEQFGSPAFFHIGCDEACPPTCPKCRAGDYNELFASLVKEFVEMFAAKGVGVMMWHDMLLKKSDGAKGGRFAGFYCNGDERAEELLAALPRSVIVCDWYYGRKTEYGQYPTLDYFTSLGFRTVTCPSVEPSGITAQGRYASDKGLYGMMVTTWADFYGRNVPIVMLNASCAAWGGEYKGPKLYQDRTSPCNEAVRQIGWDMGVSERRNTGFFDEQRPSTTITTIAW